MVVREERHIMKIVVVSDVENSLRRQHIEGEISNVGVNFTFLMQLWLTEWNWMILPQKHYRILF